MRKVALMLAPNPPDVRQKVEINVQIIRYNNESKEEEEDTKLRMEEKH